MKKLWWGYGLTVVLYASVIPALMALMTGSSTFGEEPWYILAALWAIIIAFPVLSLGLFVWSIRELLKRNWAFLGVFVLSGAFVGFLAYRAIAYPMEQSARIKDYEVKGLPANSP